MDEQNPAVEEKEEYVPRPRWQIWLARIALVILIISILLYYHQIAYPR